MLETYLTNIGGVAKEELEAQDPFFAEHGGKDIMFRAKSSEPRQTDKTAAEDATE